MTGRLTNFSNVFSRFGDLVLAILVVCIIGLLIIPLVTGRVRRMKWEVIMHEQGKVRK